MSDLEDDRVADIADDSDRLFPKHPNQKSTCYRGHCATCDKGRMSDGFRYGRRQGHKVPVDVVVPSRPCDADYKHDRMCSKCWKLWYKGCLPAPTTRVHRAMMRDGADNVSESAASALLDLSSRAPMDLDLEQPVTPPPPRPDATDSNSDSGYDSNQIMPSHKRKRRVERAEAASTYSGGSQRAILRKLLEAYTHTVKGVKVITVPNERGQPLRLIASIQPRKGNDEVCKRTIEERTRSIKRYRSLSSSFADADDDIKNKNDIKSMQIELKQSSTQFREAIKNIGLLVPAKLSAEDTLAFKSILNLSHNGMRSAFTFLNSTKRKHFCK